MNNRLLCAYIPAISCNRSPMLCTSRLLSRRSIPLYRTSSKSLPLIYTSRQTSFIPTRTLSFARPLRTMTEQQIESASLPSSAPGEQFEVRQTHATEDYKPDPSKSIKLSPARQALVDDIIALYGCEPTVERVKRYTPDCVYDDQFVYANDRYKMAGQWFALPKLFKASVNEGYQIVKDEPGLIQFRNEQVRRSLSE